MLFQIFAFSLTQSDDTAATRCTLSLVASLQSLEGLCGSHVILQRSNKYFYAAWDFDDCPTTTLFSHEASVLAANRFLKVHSRSQSLTIFPHRLSILSVYFLSPMLRSRFAAYLAINTSLTGHIPRSYCTSGSWRWCGNISRGVLLLPCALSRIVSFSFPAHLRALLVPTLQMRQH
jgi:hypothetical protein